VFLLHSLHMYMYNTTGWLGHPFQDGHEKLANLLIPCAGNLRSRTRPAVYQFTMIEERYLAAVVRWPFVVDQRQHTNACGGNTTVVVHCAHSNSLTHWDSRSQGGVVMVKGFI
jgi:hypothetical protein